jgi:MscS family membrane protein
MQIRQRHADPGVGRTTGMKDVPRYIRRWRPTSGEGSKWTGSSERGRTEAIVVRALLFVCALALVVSAPWVEAQTRWGTAASAAALAAPAARTPPPGDPLGRKTPKGTVLGFLDASRKGQHDVAAQFLNLGQGQPGADEIAHELFTILDARLPSTDLLHLNNTPEGSRENPLAPGEERIASIRGPDGPVDIRLERVTRPNGPIWLFSRKTLGQVHGIYEDVEATRTARFGPHVLIENRFAGVRLFDWLAMLLGLGALYLFIKALNWGLTRAVSWLYTRVTGRPRTARSDVLPLPARLLMLTIGGRWVFLQMELSLRVRQLLSNVAAPVAIAVLVWLGLVVARDLERYVLRRIPSGEATAWVSLARLGRRLLDGLVILFGIIIALRHFGVDPTPLVAGLGVGGIAVALAAQKTLENVIAGASLIMDQAVRVGDALKVGDITGTVDYIGLRSTRIRTADRTIVSVPNGQIANMTLETMSVRDKYWFHPIVPLRYETRGDQMQAIIEGIRLMLASDRAVESDSLRVSFLRMGTFSLDIEVFAYVFASDWGRFLQIQEGMLLRIMEIVEAAGAQIALPSQTMYVSAALSQVPLPTPQVPTPK